MVVVLTRRGGSLGVAWDAKRRFSRLMAVKWRDIWPYVIFPYFILSLSSLLFLSLCVCTELNISVAVVGDFNQPGRRCTHTCSAHSRTCQRRTDTTQFLAPSVRWFCKNQSLTAIQWRKEGVVTLMTILTIFNGRITRHQRGFTYCECYKGTSNSNGPTTIEYGTRLFLFFSLWSVALTCVCVWGEEEGTGS